MTDFTSVDFPFVTQDYVTSKEESLFIKPEDSLYLELDNKCQGLTSPSNWFHSARMFTEDEARLAYSAVFERILTAEGGNHRDQSL